MTDKPLTKEQRQQLALQLGGTGAASLSIPASTIFPFQNYLNDTAKTKIKQKEAMRMFPQADPSLFQPGIGGGIIPLTERETANRIFGQRISLSSPLLPSNIYRGKQFFPEYLSGQPGEPSPELGSYQTFLQQKPPSTEGSIQAVTVTPGPGPSRFSAEPLEKVDELGKLLSTYERQKRDWLNEKGGSPITKEQLDEIEGLRKQAVPQAGQVWGNIEKPQYGYAQRTNPNTGEYIQTNNPSLYVSRFEASPFKQADYLYTADVEQDPRVKLHAYPGEGKTTGPSWGIRSESSSSGRADADVNFRRDLIEARGELTTGDIQALLKQKKLPFDYQTTTLTKDSSKVLSDNLNRLAQAESLTPYQTIEKYARKVPALGDPAIPSTPAIQSNLSKFPAQGPAISPFGKFAAKTDLRQLGILPPGDKATYSPFVVDGFETQFKHIYPRYGALTLENVDTYTAPVDSNDIFAELLNDKQKVVINRDVLRPQAANKFLNKTADKLIQQAKPIQGLGIGGLAAGAIATAMDPAIIDALSRGDYLQAGTSAVVNTSIGSAVGGVTAKGLQALQGAGYARPAAAVASALPLAGGVLAGLGAAETGKALNRVYKAQTGKDWVTRNQPSNSYPVPVGPTPTIQPRMGTAILGGKPVQVPYGSVAGTKKVGRPWWDTLGSKAQQFADLLNRGSIIGR